MNDEDFKKLAARYRPPFSQAMEEFCLEQSRKYWREFQEWSTDDLNRLLVQLFDKDAAPHEVHLPDGSNFVGCKSGKPLHSESDPVAAKQRNDAMCQEPTLVS
jgi:hypothetical protein